MSMAGEQSVICGILLRLSDLTFSDGGYDQPMGLDPQIKTVALSHKSLFRRRSCLLVIKKCLVGPLHISMGHIEGARLKTELR